MNHPNLNWIANYIWGIADDVLRDVYARGKYRDVILPMTVLRRLDAVLEPTKQAAARHESQAGRRRGRELGRRAPAGGAVTLMAKLVFQPVADQIESGTYLLYDGACGTGGMLTLAEDVLHRFAEERG